MSHPILPVGMRARYQRFTQTSEPHMAAARLAALRAELAKHGVSGLLLPRADMFQGEYLPASEDRLAWLTGFTGSAGFVILLGARTALFVDGRYTLQAQEQTDPAAVEVVRLADIPPDDWLTREAESGARIGYDASLFTARGLKRFERAAAEAGLVLVALPYDPVITIWQGRPAAPATIVVDHPLDCAGESAADKLTRVQAALQAARLDALVASEGPSVNWLLNIRAGDVPHLPILRAFALVPQAGRATLFVDPARLEPGLAARLAPICSIISPEGDDAGALEAALLPLARAGARIRLDEESAAIRFSRFIEAAGGRADHGRDPIALMKAQKNGVEIAGTRAAHIRDGAAMVKFLAWLETAQSQRERVITEIDAAIALEGFRRGSDALMDLAFPSISAAGPHAAMPHYHVSEASNLPLSEGLYLIDSGGQYRDGTTDITRTVMIGAATGEMKRLFTLVLKGVIAISRAVFPTGTAGAQIDAFARHALWQAGYDFDHGTGHGVGVYLSVHEGPQRLARTGTEPLLPGMILSNEPGYYREGAFGIRIENLLIVEERAIAGAERSMLGFETLSFCPIDRHLILPALLDAGERAWLDAYHSEVLAKIGPLVAGDDAATRFLAAACAPL